MSGRTSNLEGPLPPIPQLTRNDQGVPITARQPCQAVTNHTPLEELPGVYTAKIMRTRGLVPDLRNDDRSYGVDQYIRRGEEVGILETRKYCQP